MAVEDLNRQGALNRINEYGKKLGDLAKEKKKLDPLPQQQMQVFQIMVEEVKYMGALLDQYCILVMNKEDLLEIDAGHRLVYKAMEEEINPIANSIFLSYEKLKQLYACLETVAPVSETGLEYFAGKFKEEYNLSLDVWKKTYELRLLIERLDAEVNKSNEQTYDDYDDDDYDFIVNP